LDILRKEALNIYAPCGRKRQCGKCIVNITGEGSVISCVYHPDKDIGSHPAGKEELIF